MIYILIFLAKCIENILSTIRIIELSKNKILRSAILNALIALTWIYSTVNIVIDIGNNVLKIIVFILGCFIGSIIGSIIDNKINKKTS